MGVPAPGLELGQRELGIGLVVRRADLVGLRRHLLQPRLLIGGNQDRIELRLQSGLVRRARRTEAQHRRRLCACKTRLHQGRGGNAGDQGEAAGGCHGRLQRRALRRATILGFRRQARVYAQPKRLIVAPIGLSARYNSNQKSGRVRIDAWGGTDEPDRRPRDRLFQSRQP